MSIPPERLEICLEVLQQIAEAPSVIDRHERMKGLIAKIHQEGKKGARRANQQAQQAEDRASRAQTVMAQVQREQRAPTTTADEAASTTVSSLLRPARCYICKAPYTELHFFYHQLCPACAALNYRMRNRRADLRGRAALVTGGRLKIGYQTALRLLQDGARVIVTTRFPYDCARRFAAEPDFDAWRDRLRLHAIDLRNTPAVEAFADYLLETEPALDILIHNAAQTIYRPPAFYRDLLAAEQRARSGEGAWVQRLLTSGPTSAAFVWEAPSDLPAVRDHFPVGLVDADGQQRDLRPTNSWRLKLAEVSSVEMLEVQLVNAVAPFALNSRLKPLMLRSPFARRFIVNVSAMEGQFNRSGKTVYHPHTNMAKAALNMMTRTSAADYARDGLYMNSVDTGWITDENPHPLKRHGQEVCGFYAPLDVIDGMARLYHPIVEGIESPEEPLYGHFLKDFAPYPW